MAPSRIRIYAAAAALPLALALVAPPARTAPPRTAIRRHGIDVNVWDYVYNNQDPGVALPAGCDERNPTPAPFEITAEQKAELEREGVVVIPGLLNKEWLAHLRAITDWQVEHPHIWASPGVASGLYDYIQRNIWTTNDAFIKFLYHSPVSTALAQLGGAKDSVRVTTDLLMVNPNKGFKWHQDNQNGPVGSFRGVPVFFLSFFATWTCGVRRARPRPASARPARRSDGVPRGHIASTCGVRRARPRPASARLRGAAMACPSLLELFTELPRCPSSKRCTSSGRRRHVDDVGRAPTRGPNGPNIEKETTHDLV